MLPVIYGLSGLTLTDDERAFFRDSNPLGYILFKRNIGDRAQLRALTDSLRTLSGRDDVPILIDQEGGKVARMTPPEWPAFPTGARFAERYDEAPASAIEAARANAHAIALTLAEVGINVNCLPLLDIRQPDTTPAVADRTLGGDPMRVAALGRAVIEGLAMGGVLGVMKHVPGHGRAVVDSHHELPVVRADADALAADIAPFRTLAPLAPMAMTAHVVFEAWDAANPATLSATVIEQVIRGAIGYDGLLMTDDIDMKALSGTAGEKAARAIAAGCDVVLDCWARMDEMVEIAGRLSPMGAQGHARLDRAMAMRRPAETASLDGLLARRDALMAA